MRRFVFKLEGLLEQRRQAENRCQLALAEAQRQMITLEKQINAASESEKASSMPLRGRIDPRTLATHVRFSQVMREKLSRLREQLDAARIDLTQAQATLVEAAKQRKVLEKLEEKQRERFNAEQQKRSTQAADDVVQQMLRSQGDPTSQFPPCPP